MTEQVISKNLKYTLIWSYLVPVILYVLFIIYGVRYDSEANQNMTMAFTALFAVGLTVGGLTFYISLGVIASKLHRSWIKWVGLSIITAPIGPLVSLLLMLGHIKKCNQNGN